jgi:hypothetical protein
MDDDTFSVLRSSGVSVCKASPQANECIPAGAFFPVYLSIYFSKIVSVDWLTFRNEAIRTWLTSDKPATIGG